MQVFLGVLRPGVAWDTAQPVPIGGVSDVDAFFVRRPAWGQLFGEWLETGDGPVEGASIGYGVDHDPSGEMVILVFIAGESASRVRQQLEASPLAHFGILELTGLAECSSGPG